MEYGIKIEQIGSLLKEYTLKKLLLTTDAGGAMTNDMIKRYRATYLGTNREIHSQNFDTLVEAESYLLDEAVRIGGLKRAYIIDREEEPPKKVRIFTEKDFA